ncbi:PREDICTED: beta-1,3-N-acetylglucosaminyltransferase radical fringe-like [Amphimedon queenslandica]|uniref:Fringe-like glycosyltransferase domain-containing protein n=2 Tax=Amphimedon queenslandica TaxID=400682 RepID=A0AAN0IL28_AMPQE|nr:PREDICTED: beta-1,3-N-acetylglucosaminyltransferase radical fringe-like [Amphimedon queenslandica]|eukprot:XP_011403569.1 PREDICTED: beta-1,3-N-acetylglucosaminyltransferase radical fringe-like [Amphimedon queenslandica]
MSRAKVYIVVGIGLALLLLVIFYETGTNNVVKRNITYLRVPHIMTLATDRPPAANLTTTVQPTVNTNDNENPSSVSSPITTPAGSTPTSHTSSVQSPSDIPYIDPRTLNESGFIEYSLGVSPLSDMKLVGHRVPEKILIPVDISDIFISVKTSSLNAYRQQTVFLTWAQTVPIDQISFTTDKATNWTDAFAAHGYKINTAPHCGLGHTDYSLCCKSGVEYDQFYKAIEAGRNFSWMCHIDDDEYMNVWKLKRMLIKYDPNKPWYIGKSHHEYWKLNPSNSGNFPEAKRKIYKFNTGNVYCLSKQIMKETEKYFRGRNFIKTCEKAHWIDDVTIAIVIVAVLGYEPTEEKQMWSHYEVLDQLPKSESLKMINFGYGKLEFGFHGRWNTSLNLPNPRFSYNADPTRFLSYHCMMYPKLKWCQ